MHHLQTGDCYIAGADLKDMRLIASVNDRPILTYYRQRFIDDDMLTVSLSSKHSDLVMGCRLPHSLVDGRERIPFPNLKHTARGGEGSSQYKNTNYDYIN